MSRVAIACLAVLILLTANSEPQDESQGRRLLYLHQNPEIELQSYRATFEIEQHSASFSAEHTGSDVLIKLEVNGLTPTEIPLNREEFDLDLSTIQIYNIQRVQPSYVSVTMKSGHNRSDCFDDDDGRDSITVNFWPDGTYELVRYSFNDCDVQSEFLRLRNSTDDRLIPNLDGRTSNQK